MIHFYYGEDTYSISAKIKAIKNAFIAKYGSDLNLIELSGEKLTLGQISNAVLTMPFLGDRKLVIIKNLMLEGDKEVKKQVIDLLAKLPVALDTVFVESGVPDKRESLFKALEKQKVATYFPLPDELALRRFVANELKREDVEIEPAALGRLTLYVGPDLWRLRNELDKLVSRARACSRKIIQKDDIEMLVEPSLEVKVFDLTDALAEKNIQKSLNIFSQFVKSGEDFFRLFGLIIFQFRSMMIVSDLVDRKIPSQNLAKEAGIHPFAVKKIENILRKVNKAELESKYKAIYETDWLIKSGKREAETALFLLFYDLCDNGIMV